VGGCGRKMLFLIKEENRMETRYLFEEKCIKKRLVFNELCIEKKIVGKFDL
jgi:hypothetical protein